MLNIINNPCVKSVNELRINKCVNRVNSSTFSVVSKIISSFSCLKSLVIQTLIHRTTTYFYTAILRIFNLLNRSFTHNPQHLLITIKNEN